MALTKRDVANINTLVLGTALYQAVTGSGYQWKMKMAYLTKNWLGGYKRDIAPFTTDVYLQHDRVGEAFEAQVTMIEEIGALIGESDMMTLADVRDFLRKRKDVKDVKLVVHP